MTDHELNVISHEHNETITDPTGAGWFDTNGAGENGDKCNAWTACTASTTLSSICVLCRTFPHRTSRWRMRT